MNPASPGSSDSKRVGCTKMKCGEYNMLECCREDGHDGEHNYVVVSDPLRDYPHNQKRRRKGASHA